MNVGIEKLNTYCGSAYIKVSDIANHRDLDGDRFDNLLMDEKSLVLPFEDPVTLAVSAAKPILDTMSDEERNKIEMLVVCTESPLDLSKSMSTYVHDYLNLNRNCRLSEIKNACYSGTFGLQMAFNFILSGVSPSAKALVIATDISRFVKDDSAESQVSDWSFVEPSSGAGAVAFLVSDTPTVFEIDIGANGYYGFEVMDTCRPIPDSEAGNNDVSLLAYLECCENSWNEYKKRVPDADYVDSFNYLAFHTPFGGMVKGAHRNMMRKLKKGNKQQIELDFEARVSPGLKFCKRVGNIMGGTSGLSLASTIVNGNFDQPQRIGIFSYGSGCCSEFFSGVATKRSQDELLKYRLDIALDARKEFDISSYDELLECSDDIRFGTKNLKVSQDWQHFLSGLEGQQVLVLKEIKDFHREYDWRTV